MGVRAALRTTTSAGGINRTFYFTLCRAYIGPLNPDACECAITGPGKPAPGSVRRKSDPDEDGTSSRLPLCACAMPSDMDSPRPAPVSIAFVVKNGSKILPAIADGMPGPLSC